MTTPIEERFDSEDIQRVALRFAAAKWITGTNVVTPEFCRFTWTPLGIERLTSLARLISPNQFATGQLPWWKTLFLKTKLHVLVLWNGLELGCKKWTQGEWIAFLAVVAHEAERLNTGGRK
jgi:hypothetical protein